MVKIMGKNDAELLLKMWLHKIRKHMCLNTNYFATFLLSSYFVYND